MRRVWVALVLVVLAAGCTAPGATAPASPTVASQSAAASPAQIPTSTHAVTPRPARATPTPTPLPWNQLGLPWLFHPASSALPTDPAHVRTLLVTGDFIPAREVNAQAVRRNDFLWTVRPTADYVKRADITYVNLEAPIFAGCSVTENGFQFCGDARNVEALKAIGAGVVNLANNHLGNYGPVGVNATTQLLQQNGMQWSGLGPAAVVDVRGLKFAFVGFNGVGQRIDREALVTGIQHARSQADVVVVQFHWGKEYERQPMADPGVPTPDDPVEIGHLAIDSGADIVIGNHPHWYQGVEVYRNKLITYAHGNYVFDQMWSEETREGVIGTYTFVDNKLAMATWKPIRIYDYGQARFEDATYDQKVMGTMEQASRDLANRLGEPT